MTKHSIAGLLTALTLLHSSMLFADECVIEQVKNAESSLTVAEIRERCAQIEIEAELEKTSPDSTSFKTGLISKRVLRESKSAFDAYVITPHRINYFLPVLSSSNINKEAYRSYSGFEEKLTRFTAEELPCWLLLAFFCPFKLTETSRPLLFDLDSEFGLP